MEKTRKVFKMADLQKIDPQLFLTRFTEGEFELPDHPGLIFHYEGLSQTILNFIYNQANDNAGLLFSMLGQSGLTGITVNGERYDLDFDIRSFGIGEKIVIRTVPREDWDGLNHDIQIAIGLKVLEASNLTEEERVKLAFTVPCEKMTAGENVVGVTMDSPINVPPANESGLSQPDEMTPNVLSVKDAPIKKSALNKKLK